MEQGSVDGDRKMLPCHDLSDPAQTVLPTLTDSRGIFTRDIKRNARGSQIDAHPVNNPTGFLAWLQLLAAVSNSLKYFRRGGAPRTCRRHERPAASAGHH